MDSKNILAVKLSVVCTILNTFFIVANHAAPAPRTDPVIGCADKLTTSCAPKVHAFVFDKSGVLSQECCERLLRAGRECHNNLTNSILREERFSTEETEEILARHDEAWNLCRRSGHIGTSGPSAAPILQPLSGCAGKVTSACGPKVYAFVFDKSGVLSKECCGRLLRAGRECHNSLTNSVLSEEEFSGEETEEILARHDEAWNLCKRSGHIGTSGPSAAPVIQPLPGCAGKITSACGPKVYAFVFDKSGVLSQECCGRLLHAGRECHNSFTNSILSEEKFSQEETEEILARHDEAWNLCKRSGHIGTSGPSAAPIVQPLPGCAAKVTSACGPKVYAFVFDKSGVVSKQCCGRLLRAGRECHNSLTNSVLSEEEFSREETEEILARHDEAWNLCKRSGHIGTSGPSAAPIVQPLPGCAGKITSACGPKVYAFVLDKSGVLPQECCGRLLHEGRECHNSLTNSILSEEEFSREEREEILARHDEAWNLCKRSGHIGTSGPAAAPIVQPRPGCAGKITSACGPRVYAFVFDKSGVLSQECCGRLLNAGRKCHDSITNSVLSEGGFSTEEKKEIVERHNEVWNLCNKNGRIDSESPIS